MEQDLLQKATRLMDTGKNGEAKDLFAEILEQEPENAKACNKLGVLFARENNLSEAKQYFMRALELNPKFSSAASNLGNIYFETGDLEKAEEYYKKALVLDPDNPLPYNNLAVIYKKQNKIGDYVKCYKQHVNLKVHWRDDLHEHRQEIHQWKGLKLLWWILGIIALIIFLKAMT